MSTKDSNENKTLDDIISEYRPVTPNDTASYNCSRCGDCCRNIGQAVMVNSLDLYNMSRHLRNSGHVVWRIEDIMSEYLEPVTITDFGYPIFVLKTTGDNEQCVFLKDNRCTIQPAKTSVCRSYPFGLEYIYGTNSFKYYIVSKRKRHFTGPAQIRVGDWMAENFTEDDRAYTKIEYAAVIRLGRIFRRLTENNIGDALRCLVFYKYINHDIDKPFMRQHVLNMAVMFELLERLV